jgi:hypothetical protein
MKLLITAFLVNGRIGQFVLWAVFGPPMFLFTKVCMWLDTLLYPQLRDTEVDRPVFILGHPRSGSTFLQHRVHESSEVAMFRTWELWFPSLVQRRIVRPFLAVLRRLDMELLQGAEYGHEIHLDGIEEDEGLFLHQLDSEIVTFICPRLVTDNRFAGIGLRFGRLTARQTRRSLAFYRACLKRQLVWRGKKKVVVKCNPSVFRLPQILKVFPDARVVYLYRDPVDGIRSFLALNSRHVSEVLSPAEQKRFFRGKYRWSVDLYRRFERVRPLLPDDRLLVLRFEEVTKDVDGTLDRFFRFAEIERSPSSRASGRGRSKKRHANPSLPSFGVRPAEVERDLGWLRSGYRS